MASKSVPIVTLILRFLALALCAASIVVLGTNKFTQSDGTKITFRDLIAYRYVIATGIIGFAYSLVQIPFAMYHVCREKRLIKHECQPEFDFYGDNIIAFLLAAGVGAGFAISFEFKRLLKEFIDSLKDLGIPGIDEGKSKGEKFLDKANLSTALLLLGFLCMTMLSVYSSIQRSNSSSSTPTTNKRGFFFK
ncbi:hypothetical protein HS088_TW03G00389 [Tripterygium wilfordii]|uniref:CASP-like protein n=1 Tax=Tripterygium wilfordii TaxID=458696 RepID=A0A7J7DUL0_TRIWF|nr:CASP-like protein 4D1 [Tripterygium wilfordii]KAF5750058.1 hypothetical protein HS088_TW03G00389 [Tripterygium wilfordii]